MFPVSWDVLKRIINPTSGLRKHKLNDNPTLFILFLHTRRCEGHPKSNVQISKIHAYLAFELLGFAR